MELAERQGRITRSLREYFLGHDLKSVELQYNLGKHLSEANLEELRAAYKRCEPFLSTAPIAHASDDATRVLRAMLLARHYPKEEVEKLDIESMSDPELEALFKNLGAGSKRVEKTFAVEQVQEILDAGWEFVSPLGGSLAALDLPALSQDSRVPAGPTSASRPN